KQFLLRRGEVVGLGVAVLLAAILILMGSRGFLAGSPQATANSLKAKSQQASQAIDNSTPPEDIQQVQPELLRSLDVGQIDPRQYQLVSAFVNAAGIEDTKRRNPEVLGPRDFEVKMFRAAYLGYLLSRDGRSIWVVQGEDIKGNINVPQNSAKVRFGAAGLGSMDAGGSADAGGDVMPAGQFAPGQAPGAPKRAAREMEHDKPGNNPNMKFAEQIYPRYVAVVSAAFPFKQQLENFRKAIDKKATLATLVAAINAGQVPFQFETLEIQRRVTLPSGRIENYTDQDEGWKSFDEQFKAFT